LWKVSRVCQEYGGGEGVEMGGWTERKRRMSRRGAWDRGYQIYPKERVYIHSKGNEEIIGDETMKMKVESRKEVPEGKHEGEIVEVQHRTTPQNYKYTDFVVVLSDLDGSVSLKFGVPTNLTEGSKLFKLLKRFVPGLKVGDEVDIDETMRYQKINFVTIQSESEKGTFTEVVEGSVKPLEA
jgi:hypothetical protein